MALPIALMQMSINGGKKKTGLLLGPAIIVCRDASNRIHTDWVNGMQSNPLRRIEGEFSMAHIQGSQKTMSISRCEPSIDRAAELACHTSCTQASESTWKQKSEVHESERDESRLRRQS